VPWEYDAGEPYARKKHGWNEAHAGVKDVCGIRVGCCPKGVSPQEASVAVNAGLPYVDDPDRERQPGAPPDRVFLVHDGVPYEARWTRRGVSLHAFPVLPELFEDLPRDLQGQLEVLAERQGHDLRAWLREWAP
jgi:hypothetical protein